MARQKVLVILGILAATAGTPWLDAPVRAQSEEVATDARAAQKEELRERAERVQERRKSRISHADREAAAERAEAARARGERNKAAKKAAPDKPAGNGKGGAQ